jgi:sortase B
MKRKILIGVLVLLIGVFAVAAYFVISDTVRSKREDGANREIVNEVGALRDQAIADADDSGDNAGEQTQSDRDIGIKPGLYGSSGIFKWLEGSYEKNNDLAGWLIIDGTYVDYPVVHTPYWEQKYLRKAFDGSYALSGTLFIGGTDWTPDSDYTVIYGHHMKDGTMFSDLVEYESLEYARTHSRIHFETLTEMFDFEVLFAVNTQVNDSKNESTLDYYSFSSFADEEAFNDFIARARAVTLYDTGVDVEYGDRILVLSTCNYHRTDERFIVIARYRPPRYDDARGEDV